MHQTRRLMCLAALAMAAAALGWAGIISTGGSVTVLPTAPAGINAGALESDTDAHTFLEQSLVLGAPLIVDNTATGTYPAAGSPGVAIAAGTFVSSYIVHSDPVGTPSGLITYAGSITFDTPILGVIFTSNRLLGTHGILGAPGTTYETLVARALEGPDTFTISTDRLTIRFDFRTNTGQDTIRVVTAAVPEPGTMGLMGIGLLLLGFGARRLRRA